MSAVIPSSNSRLTPTDSPVYNPSQRDSFMDFPDNYGSEPN